MQAIADVTIETIAIHYSRDFCIDQSKKGEDIAHRIKEHLQSNEESINPQILPFERAYEYSDSTHPLKISGKTQEGVVYEITFQEAPSDKRWKLDLGIKSQNPDKNLLTIINGIIGPVTTYQSNETPVSLDWRLNVEYRRTAKNSSESQRIAKEVEDKLSSKSYRFIENGYVNSDHEPLGVDKALNYAVSTDGKDIVLRVDTNKPNRADLEKAIDIFKTAIQYK